MRGPVWIPNVAFRGQLVVGLLHRFWDVLSLVVICRFEGRYYTTTIIFNICFLPGDFFIREAEISRWKKVRLPLEPPQSPRANSQEIIHGLRRSGAKKGYRKSTFLRARELLLVSQWIVIVMRKETMLTQIVRVRIQKFCQMIGMVWVYLQGLPRNLQTQPTSAMVKTWFKFR